MAERIAADARQASTLLKTLSNDARTSALKAIHDGLRDSKDKVLEANRTDLARAKADSALSSALVKRLDLTGADKYESMLQGILDVAALDDPMGRITLATRMDDGLDLYRVTCPVGVLLVIFEARPEVIANISALAIKSGNAAILKGGKESQATFAAMAEVVTASLGRANIPPHALQLVDTREQVGELLKQDKDIDLVIPRGSNELVRSIKANTKIPVLGHADGLCSIYVHEDADVDMACRVIVDAKTNYPAGCNATETVLVHAAWAKSHLSKLAQALVGAGVTVKAHENVAPLLPSSDLIVPATASDFDTEFLALTLALKAVESQDEAMVHINQHGSHHTDVILTESQPAAERFFRGIDSAGVYWNASTRFADGFRYGFGTEVGVSTNKIHARGPMGLEGLMVYQYQLRGSGQVAGDYVGAGGQRVFKHVPIV